MNENQAKPVETTTANNAPLLEVTDLVKSYASEEGFLAGLIGGSSKRIPALNGVSLTLNEGEILGLTGESGSGKSALGKIIAGVERPDRGRVMFMGQNLSAANENEVRKQKRYLRYISEDNFSNLSPADPKNRVDNLLYSLLDHYEGKGANRGWADELLRRVGLNADYKTRYPHQLSGGERQRLAIARALTTKPKLIVADEPVSNLDLTTRTQMLRLLRSIGKEFGIAFIFISHDASMVRYFAEGGHTAFMFAGRIMETMPTRDFFDRPTHPYTKTLLDVTSAPSPLPAAAFDGAITRETLESREARAAAIATLDGEASDLSLEGNVAAAGQLAAANQPGCPFYRWCPEHFETCKTETPQLLTVTRQRNEANQIDQLPRDEVDEQHRAACLLYNNQVF